MGFDATAVKVVPLLVFPLGGSLEMSRAVTCKAYFLKCDTGTTKHIFTFRRNLNTQKPDDFWFEASDNDI